MEGTHLAARVPDGDRPADSLRLLFVVPFTPRRDATHGGRVVAQLLFHLIERHRVAIVYLRWPGSPSIESPLASRCDAVEEIPLSGKTPVGSGWRHRVDIATSPFTGVPSPAAALRNPHLARTCVELAARWKPDVVQIEHDNISYCGPVLKRSGSDAIRVLTCHEPGPLAARDQAQRTSGRQRWAHRLDAGTWLRYWARTLPSFDAIVALTESDRDEIKAAVDGVPIFRIGLGIDIPPYPLSATGADDTTVVFVGGYTHPPNTDAAIRLMHSIMPMVRQTIPQARLLVVGANPGQEVLDARGPNDTVTGTVDDVAQFVDRASLLALPIRLGGGMRVKLLEALAAGKAVVASPLAAAGLEASDGRELVLAGTDAEFADSIVRLLSDREARARLGGNARRWAARHLGWEARLAQYEQMYRSLLATGT